MKLLTGLGNPGEGYARHRHNAGFMAVEAIADRYNFAPWKKRFQGLAAEGEIDGQKVLLLKPMTYMNESGRAVGEAMRFLKIAPSDLIVFHDELDIEPARMKAKVGGGNAGHNGLKSISAHQGNDYTRVRIGIGHPGVKDAVAAYVLHDFAKAERAELDALFDAMARAAGLLLDGKTELFVSDVARATRGDSAGKGPDKSAAEPAGRKSEAGPARAPGPASSRPRHPSGDRASKQQNALAENLRKWLAGKAGKE